MTDRAYDMAEAWANDPERLAGLLKQNMTDEQFAGICAHLAACFVALTDDSTHEKANRKQLIEIALMHGEIVELIFLPVAEKLVRQADGAGTQVQPLRRAA